MYFGSSRPGSGSTTDLWVTTRASLTDPWQEPVSLGANVNDPDAWDLGPTVTGDGLELIFNRTENPFVNEEASLWVSRRAEVTDPWGVAEPLEIATPGSDYAPKVSFDGLTLYITSSREQTETPFPVNTWVTTRPSRSEPFADPEFFFVSGTGYVVDDGLTNVFSGIEAVADYLGIPSSGGEDIFFRTRESVANDFGSAFTPGAPLNSSGEEFLAVLPGSGDTIYFNSTRPGAPADGLAGFVNLWQAPLAEALSFDANVTGLVEPIDWRTEEILVAAILSTAEFNAPLSVDDTTLLFGDPLLIADGATPVGPTSTGAEDVNGDGLVDLVLELSISEMLGNGVIGLSTEEGYFAGQLLDGSHVAGRDGLTFIPEPGSSVLIFLGLISLAVHRRR